MDDYTDKRLQPRFSLKEACPELVESLARYLTGLVENDLVDQLQRTMVASWRIANDAGNFTFVAFPVPVSTTAERMQMTLVPERSIEMKVENKNVKVEVDDFGEIFRFTVVKWPQVHEQLKKHMLPSEVT